MTYNWVGILTNIMRKQKGVVGYEEKCNMVGLSE